MITTIQEPNSRNFLNKLKRQVRLTNNFSSRPQKAVLKNPQKTDPLVLKRELQNHPINQHQRRKDRVLHLQNQNLARKRCRPQRPLRDIS